MKPEAITPTSPCRIPEPSTLLPSDTGGGAPCPALAPAATWGEGAARSSHGSRWPRRGRLPEEPSTRPTKWQKSYTDTKNNASKMSRMGCPRGISDRGTACQRVRTGSGGERGEQRRAEPAAQRCGRVCWAGASRTQVTSASKENSSYLHESGRSVQGAGGWRAPAALERTHPGDLGRQPGGDRGTGCLTRRRPRGLVPPSLPHHAGSPRSLCGGRQLGTRDQSHGPSFPATGARVLVTASGARRQTPGKAQAATSVSTATALGAQGSPCHEGCLPRAQLGVAAQGREAGRPREPRLHPLIPGSRAPRCGPRAAGLVAGPRAPPGA